jgi:hypothetical protein
MKATFVLCTGFQRPSLLICEKTYGGHMRKYGGHMGKYGQNNIRRTYGNLRRT